MNQPPPKEERPARVTAYAEVSVSIEEFSTQDLLKEYKRRNLLSFEQVKDLATEMFYAFHLGASDRAIQLARQLAQEVTGRVLGK